MNTYAHLWPTAEDRTRTAASGLFAAATTDPATARRRPGG
ncbi:MAG: Phage integrase family protein [uncultured Frankineae bacterium]|uniref:Phage integrase family protein n=1 Tax=uncultured Frankineae bacterium TaxID=437475 RepID=A0A6J4MML1_9ACTN|nr:MAG: Phage integrase family protein [uncultured Frankineae bacterium]